MACFNFTPYSPPWLDIKLSETSPMKYLVSSGFWRFDFLLVDCDHVISVAYVWGAYKSTFPNAPSHPGPNCRLSSLSGNTLVKGMPSQVFWGSHPLRMIKKLRISKTAILLSCNGGGCVSQLDSIAFGGVFAHYEGVSNTTNLTAKRKPIKMSWLSFPGCPP